MPRPKAIMRCCLEPAWEPGACLGRACTPEPVGCTESQEDSQHQLRPAQAHLRPRLTMTQPAHAHPLSPANDDAAIKASPGRHLLWEALLTPRLAGPGASKGSPALGLPYVAWMEYGVTCDRKPSPLPNSDQLKQKRNCVHARNCQVQGVLRAQRGAGLTGSASFRGGAISWQFRPPSALSATLAEQSFFLCLAVLKSASELGLPGCG